MNDYISRQMIINAIEEMKPYHQDADDIAEMIQNLPSPCTKCPNSPANGGSGVCNCILGIGTIV